MKLLSAPEAAERLGVSTRRVIQFIAEGRLPAQRVGARTWAIREADLDAFQQKPPGRPPKD